MDRSSRPESVVKGFFGRLSLSASLLILFDHKGKIYSQEMLHFSGKRKSREEERKGDARLFLL